MAVVVEVDVAVVVAAVVVANVVVAHVVVVVAGKRAASS